MGDRGELLRQGMRETRTTQSELSRLSGVHQPSISQFLSGRVEMSDDMLDRCPARASASRWSGVRSSAS